MTNCKRGQFELWDSRMWRKERSSAKKQVFFLKAGWMGRIFLISELVFLLGLGTLARGPPGCCHSCSNCTAGPPPSRTRLWGTARHLCEGNWALLGSTPGLPTTSVFSMGMCGMVAAEGLLESFRRISWGGCENFMSYCV